jgi:predicted transcriptional regulator
MAIHPGYADAILDGRKKVEFRKRGIAEDVTTVLIYATAPVKKIIGEFKVADTVVTTPTALWHRMGAVGCIEEPMYRAYYAASDSAVGLLVDAPKRYEVPVELDALVPSPAVPQSFAYLSRGVYEQAQMLGQPTGRGSRPHALRQLADLLRRLVKQHPLTAVMSTPLRLTGEQRKETEQLSALR